MKIRDMTEIALCVAVITVCAYITVPLTVPVTLQTMGIFLVSLLLGRKKSVIAVIVYILLGCVGVPVFSNFRGGFSVIFGATGGYIIGFVFIALIVGFASDKYGSNFLCLVFAMLIGLTVCYITGTLWFYFIYAGAKGIEEILTVCVVPFMLPDMGKIVFAIILFKAIKPKLKKI